MEQGEHKPEPSEKKVSEKKGVKHHVKSAHAHVKKAAPHVNKALSFMKKHAVVLTLLLVLALQFVPNDGGKYPWGGLHMRTLSEDLPLAQNAANTNVENFVRQEASRLAAQQYPNLPDRNRERVIQDVMKKVREDFGDRLESEQARVAQEIKDHYSYEANGESYTYMPDIDTYFYLRYARNVVETGVHYDELRNGVPWDNHMSAPIGTTADRTWHPYVIAWIYKLHRVVNPDTTLMQSMTYFPIIFMFLGIICAFLISWRISGAFGGFFGATMLAVTPGIFGRTTWGHADTDTYNVFFPLLCVWLMVEAIVSKSAKRQAIFAALAGLSVAAYTQFWSGWWYVFDFMLGALVIGFVWSIVSNWSGSVKKVLKSDQVKKYMLIGVVLFLTSAIFGSMSVGTQGFVNGAFRGALSFTTIKEATLPTLWPNVLTTVAELNPTSLLGGGGQQGIIPSLGGVIMFVTALLGVMMLLVNTDKKKGYQLAFTAIMLVWIYGTLQAYIKGMNWLLLLAPLVAIVSIVAIIWKSERSLFEKVFYPAILLAGLAAIVYASHAGIDFLIVLGPMFLVAVGLLVLFFNHEEIKQMDIVYAALLALWFVGTIYAALKGVRFILLLGPAFAVAFGACAGRMYELFSHAGKKYLHMNKFITGAIVFLLFSIVIVGVPGKGQIVKSDFQSLQGDVPIVNDAWWDVLSKVREESEPSAIVNSWWDFGHHFKYISDRAVTFDGSSQNSPQAHWIGRVLQTDNEKEAVAILRMLDCGANTAFDMILEQTEDPLRTIKLTKEIILLPKSNASERLDEEGISSDVLKFTHCDPPENYFIASGDMVGKAGVWSHFGLWNFEYAEVWLKWKDEPKSVAVPKMIERFGWSEEEAEGTWEHANSLESEEAGNQWISPWLSYISTPQSCSIEGEMLNCGNVRMNRSSTKIEVSVQGGVAIPGKVISYNRQGESSTVNISEGNAGLAVVIWPDANNLYAMVSVEQLANSMFTRMFYMNGLGLEHFRPFAHSTQLLGGRIHVYDVDWEGGEKFVPDALRPKESVVDGARTRVNYIGFTDEGIFDSSIIDWQGKNLSQFASFDTFETKPLPFIMGKGQLIPGFEEGMENMTPGDERTIVIPAEKAYGTDPAAHPLGNKTLTFRVRVESIE